VPQVLAVDFGGTKTTIACIDDRGDVRERVKIPAARVVDESVEQVVATLRDLDGVGAIGVIVPGIYDRSTGRAWCPNLWGSDEVPLGGALRQRAGIPVVIDSDRAGYVLGESWLGVARGLRDVAFVAIGTGIGVGILSGGRVVPGAHGIAGAAGWFALDPSWADDFARCGCWEAEAAGPALARRFGAGDAAAVVAAAHEGDSKALDLLARAALYTGMGVANLISLLDPEMIVLGGGVMQGAGDLLLEPVRAEASRWAQPIAFSRCRIELTQLGEDAGLYGAARLALDLNS
jgi:glucokinase